MVLPDSYSGSPLSVPAVLHSQRAGLQAVTPPLLQPGDVGDPDNLTVFLGEIISGTLHSSSRVLWTEQLTKSTIPPSPPLLLVFCCGSYLHLHQSLHQLPQLLKYFCFQYFPIFFFLDLWHIFFKKMKYSRNRSRIELFELWLMESPWFFSAILTMIVVFSQTLLNDELWRSHFFIKFTNVFIY